MNFANHVKIRNEKFGTVVFDTLTEKIFITDQVGAEILRLIEQSRNLPEIIDVLSSNYDGERQTIEKDIFEFVGQLKSNNIICV